MEDLAVKAIALLLLVVWAYSGLEKLLDWEASRQAFQNQPFPEGLATLLAYGVPLVEIALALLLVGRSLRWWGLLGSILLLAVFTTYIGLVWWNAFERVPCNCAGFIEVLGWSGHLYFNGSLLALGIIALKLESDQRSLQ